MQLTKEYFDQAIKKLVTKKELEKELDRRTKNLATKDELKNLATKDDLKAQSVELKEYVRDSFGAQQTYLEERFDEVQSKLDVRNKVSVLKYDMQRVKQKLGMSK